LVRDPGLLPGGGRFVQERALLVVADQLGVGGQGFVDLGRELVRALAGVELHRLAGAYQAAVGRGPVLTQQGAELAGRGHALHAAFGEVGGGAVERRKPVVGTDTLRGEQHEHHAESQHQLRRELEVLDPLHCSVLSRYSRQVGLRDARTPEEDYFSVASLMLDGEVTAISARLASRWTVPTTQTSRPSSSSGVGLNLPRWSPGMRAEKVWRGKVPPMYRKVGSPSVFWAQRVFSTLPQTITSLPTKRSACSAGTASWA